MKRLLDVAILITLALSMGACASEASPAPIPTVALDAQAAAPSASAVTASVEVVPAQVAHLSFVISAPVKEILVHEGDEVKAGEPLITLDAPDLEYGQAAAEQAYKSAQVDNFIQSQGRRKFILDRYVWVGGTPEQRRQAEARVDSTQRMRPPVPATRRRP
jgi:multidrug efflux pump subunit AcrA (membrane-fusion protein)